MSTNWTEHVMWWHVYPLGFVGAPIRPEQHDDTVTHRLGAIEPWLDHVVHLGLNGLLLGPVFESTSHGYDTLDHFTIDRRLGDDADFDQLVAAAKERGLRVLLDGVFNHVGRQHPAFLDVEKRGPQSSHAGLFSIDWEGWVPGDAVKSNVFEGHDILVGLDHGSPQTEDLVVEVMDYWLDRGIDGWRLDAAYAVPAEFWARVLTRVRQKHPDAWFTGEVIHGASLELAEQSTIDSLTQYELWQGTWHAIVERNLFELSHALERHTALLPGYVPSTFVGNHDVTRIASAVGGEHVGHALAVLLTVAGVPSIYAGDEFGWQAVKEDRLGGDDAVRPAFPAAPPEHLDSDSARVPQQHQQLLSVRRRHAWLHSAPTEVLSIANETLVFRTSDDEHAIVTALNLGDAELRVPHLGMTAVEAGNATIEGTNIVIPPNDWAVLS